MDNRLIKKHKDNLKEILAGDKCYLKEIFHPERDNVKTSYSLACAHVKPGGRTIDHTLNHQTETYYILSGEGTMYIDKESFKVSPGSSFYIPAGCHQYLVNDGKSNLEFLVVVDPPWNQEDEIVFE